MCTGRIARVRDVIAASTAAGSRFSVSGAMSANTGAACWNNAALAEATNENPDVTTSSPGPMPSRARHACRPAVPLEQATENRLPDAAANDSSNRASIGPSASEPERSTSSTSSSSRASIDGRASGMVRVMTTAIALRADGCRGRIFEELAPSLLATRDHVEEHTLQVRGDGAAPAAGLVVDRRHRRHLGGRAAQEHLVRVVEVRAHQADLTYLVAQLGGDPHHAVAGDARQAGVADRRRVDDAVTDDEHVLARAVGDEPLLVQQDRLLVATARRLVLGEHRVDVLAGRLGRRRQ